MRLLRLPLKLKRLSPHIVQERLKRLQNESYECDITLNNESGVLKFSLGSLNNLNRTMSQSLSRSHRNSDSDSITDFYQRKANYIYF